MKYLWNTVSLPLVMEAKNLYAVEWWVDALFAVHSNMRSHTGCVMMLGAGAVYASSTKQKLNTRSSTEAKLVGVYDAMPHLLWTRKFLAAQEVDNGDSIIHQDNQSAMLLEKHGKSSSSKRTRHIDVRYYYIADCVAGKEVEVKYCPAGEMLADSFTKPLQGSLFVKFHDLIMNSVIDPDNKYNQDHRSVLEKKESSLCNKRESARGPLKLMVK